MTPMMLWQEQPSSHIPLVFILNLGEKCFNKASQAKKGTVKLKQFQLGYNPLRMFQLQSLHPSRHL